MVLLNKWDLLKDDYEREAVMETVDRRLTMAPWAEYLRISAMTGRSVHKIWDMVDAAAERRASHITTSQLNKLLTDMREFGHTVSDGKRRLKMHYVTQTGEKPPAFTRASHITTSQLNKLLTDMREFGHTVSDGKRRLKMHYVTQTGEKPPAFTFFVNHTDLVSDNYKRYIENRMRRWQAPPQDALRHADG